MEVARLRDHVKMSRIPPLGGLGQERVGSLDISRSRASHLMLGGHESQITPSRLPPCQGQGKGIGAIQSPSKTKRLFSTSKLQNFWRPPTGIGSTSFLDLEVSIL